jgi:7-carboxy-7-deazaguanine synthase
MISFDTTREIPVMEHFYTLQGEGAYTGYAAYFIRLAGCDVGCHWCDVKESWAASAQQLMGIEDLSAQAAKHPGRLAVITGGEPLMYDLKPLTDALKRRGFRIHIETSGAYPLSGDFDWICVSPKKFKPPLEEIFPLAQELKIIIFNTSDFSWAGQFATKVSPICRLYLQPEWDNMHKVIPQIIEFIKSNPHWQLSLQTHKYLNIP